MWDATQEKSIMLSRLGDFWYNVLTEQDVKLAHKLCHIPLQCRVLRQSDNLTKALTDDGTHYHDNFRLIKFTDADVNWYGKKYALQYQHKTGELPDGRTGNSRMPNISIKDHKLVGDKLDDDVPALYIVIDVVNDWEKVNLFPHLAPYLGEEVVLYWGDGAEAIEFTAETVTEELLTHTYERGGVYTIGIYGGVMWKAVKPEDDALKDKVVAVLTPTKVCALFEVDNGVGTGLFAQYSQLNEVGDKLFSNLKSIGVKDLTNAFKDCPELTVVSYDLLAHLPDTEELMDYSSMFQGDGNVVDIPEWWNNAKLQNSQHQDCFTGCVKAPNYLVACAAKWASRVEGGGGGGGGGGEPGGGGGGEPGGGGAEELEEALQEGLELVINVPSDNYTLDLSATLTNYSRYYSTAIDWGCNNHFTTLLQNMAPEEMRYTYPKKGQYTIRVYGAVVWGSAEAILKQITVIDAAGELHDLADCLIKVQLPTEKSSICLIRDREEGAAGIFSDCTQLSSVPINLFDNLQTHSIREFIYAFQNTAITTIYPEWFAGLAEQQDLGEVFFNNAFAKCTKLTQVPQTLFTAFFQWPKLLLHLNAMFYGCTGLTSVAKELLSTTNSSHTVWSTDMFRGCTGVTASVPDWWSVDPLEASPHTNCFTGCRKSPNYIFACVRGWAEDINNPGSGGDGEFAGGIPRLALHVTIPSAKYSLTVKAMTYENSEYTSVVDFGDGADVIALQKYEADNALFLNKTYAKAGDYVINIYGEIVWLGVEERMRECLTQVDVPMVQKCAIRSYHNIGVAWFYGCSKLTSVTGKVFNNLDAATVTDLDLRDAFGDTGLTEVPAGLFNNIPDGVKTLDCEGMFALCSQLVSCSPSTLFGSFTQITDLNCRKMFVNCSKLKDTIGRELFRSQSLVTNLDCSSMFSGCTSITNVALDNLFDNCPMLQSLICNYMFIGDAAIKGAVPSTLFSVPAPRLLHLQCTAMFTGCTGLTGEAKETLFSGFRVLTALYASEMFSGCTGITAINDGLLRGVGKLSSLTTLMLNSMFKGCSNVTGVCPDYWNTPSLEASQHASFYTGCTKTTNYEIAVIRSWAEGEYGSMTFTVDIPSANYVLDLSNIIARYSEATEDPILVWGDASDDSDILYLQSDTPTSALVHTYKQAGVYTIRFVGQFTMRTRLDANGQLDVLTKILTKVETPGENGCIYRIENQGTTADHECGTYAYTNGIFFKCSKLTEVGENVFSNLTSFGDKANFGCAFEFTPIKKIYSKWLQHVPVPADGVLNLRHFFAGPHNVTVPELPGDILAHLPSGVKNLILEYFFCAAEFSGAIPENLLASLPSTVTTLSCQGMFKFCDIPAGTIPAGLFKKLPTGVTTLTLTEMFSTTRTLHTIPGDLLSALPSGLKTLRCVTMFQNSDAITAVPSNLFSSLPQLTELNCQQMFQQCDGFTSIPDALLRSLPTSITTGNLNNMFNTCSMVGGDLPTWWDKPQLEGFSHKDCFTGCTKATNYMLAQVQGWASGVPDIGLNLTITTPSANFILDLSQRVARYSKATFDPVIDWGDGSEQTEITNLKHTYTAQGTYTVKIYGEIIWQKLATPITDDSKQDSLCKCLTRIDVPGAKCAIVDATNVAYAGWFAQCHLLATIPAKLFSNLKNVAAVNFDRAFYGTAISSIPAALFSGIPAALKPTTLSCVGTFCNCPNLSSIPEALFKGLPSTLTTVNLVNCFQTSPKITTVPATLFSYLPSGVKTLVLQGALMCGTASSGGLTAIPNTLLHKLPSGLTSFNMWALCWNQTQLRDVPADFFAKLPTGIKDLDIHRCFMNCKKLTTIPAALLTSIPSAVGIKDLTEMFRDCSAVTGTLPEYWNTAKLEAVTHTDFYTGCTKATNYATADAKGWATSNFSLTFTITPTASTLTIDLSKRIGTNAVNSTLDWGDGSAVVKISGGNLKHTYAKASTYTITIKGQIWLAAQASNKGDAFSQSLTAISTPTGMSSIVEVRAATAPDAGIFANCTKLTSIAANIFAMVSTNNMTIMQEPTLPIPEMAADSEEDVLAEVVIETVTLPLPEVDTMMEETPQLEVVPEEIIQDPIATLPEAEKPEEETVVDLEPHGHIGEDGNAVLFRHGDKDVELADYATLHFSLRVDPDIKVTSIRTLSGRMLFEHQDFISRFGQLIFPQNPITLFPEMQFMAQSYDYRRRNVYCYPLGVDVYGQVDRILYYTRVSQSPKSLYLASAQAAGFPVVREDCEVLSVVPMHSGVIYYTTHGHYEAPFPHAHLPVGTHLKAGEVIAGNQLYRMVLPGDTLPGNVQYINLDYALPIRGLRAPNREIQVYTEPDQLRPEFEGNSTTLARYHRWLSKYDGTYDYSRHIPARMNAIELVRDYLCAGRCIIVCVNTYHITDEMYLRLDNFLRRELPLGSVLVTAPYHGLINEVESSWGAVVEPGPPPQQVPNGEDWPNGAPGSQGSGGQGSGGHYGDEEVEAPEGTYEFVIDQSQSDPDKMITYAGTNKKYTPAHINDSTGMLDYGDWEDSWLLQAFRPCMLHADGTVAYYLNPLDLSQKESGESAMSDLTSDTHDMNAMVEVGQIWIREVVEGANKFHVYIAPTKAKGFDCYTHYNEKNGMVDKYYFGMYKGSLDANRKIRSLSGKTPCTNYTGELQKEYCANNGAGWSCREWSFQRLMQYICLLLGKNANTQAVFGNGYWEGGKALKTGGNELRGLFYGSTKNRTTHMTLLGMEDFWGNVSDLCNGLWNENGVYKVKLTPGTADGSEAPGYTDNTAAYTTLDVVPPVTAKCEYATQMMAVPGKGLFPTGAQGGSSALYYTDGINATKEGLAAARVGYGSPAETVGAFALDVSAPITGFDAADGVTLSYKDAGVVSGGPSTDDGEDDSANGSIRFKLVTTEQNMEVDVSDWFYTNEAGYHGIIDWGDGSFQTSIIPLQSKSELKHTYTTPGDYWLEVTGKVTMGDGQMKNSDTIKKILQAVEVVDECPVVKFNQAFRIFKALQTVTLDKLFTNHILKKATSLDVQSLFSGCTNLNTAIPANMFPEGLTSLNCDQMFLECHALTCSLPENMFPSTLKTLICNSMFNNHTAISGLPEHLFPEGLQTLSCTTFIESTNQFEVQLTSHFFPESITSLNCRFFFGFPDDGPKAVGAMPADFFPPALSYFNGEFMFNANTNLTSIPADLGTHLPTTSETKLERMFQCCTGITGAVPELWETHQNTSHKDCFSGCINATNWADVPEDWGGDAKAEPEVPPEDVRDHQVGDHEDMQEGNLLWWQWDKILLPTGQNKLRRITIHCRSKLASTAYTGPVYLGVWDVYEPENDVRRLGVSTNTQTPSNGGDMTFTFEGDIKFTSGRSLRFLPLLKKDDLWYDPPTTILSLKCNTVESHATEPETYVHNDKNSPAYVRVVGEMGYVYVDDYVEPEPEPKPEPEPEPNPEQKPESSRTDENGYTERVLSWYAGKGDKEDDPHYRGTGYIGCQGFAFRTSASPYFQEDWPYVRIPLTFALLPKYEKPTYNFRYVYYAWCWSDDWKASDWRYSSVPGATVSGLKLYNPRTLKEITGSIDTNAAGNLLPFVPIQKNSKGQYFVDIPVYTTGLKWSGVIFGLDAKQYDSMHVENQIYLKADIFVPQADVFDDSGLTPDNVTSTACPDLNMVVLSSTDTYWGLKNAGVVGRTSGYGSYPATLPDVTLVNKTPSVNKWSGTENYNGLTIDQNNNIFPVCENKDYATEEKAYYRGEGKIGCDGFIIRTAALGEAAKTAESIDMTITIDEIASSLSTVDSYSQGNLKYAWVVSDNWQDGKYWQAPFETPAWGTSATDSSVQLYNPTTKAVIPKGTDNMGTEINSKYQELWQSLPAAIVVLLNSPGKAWWNSMGTTYASTKRDITVTLPLVHPVTKKRLTWTGVRLVAQPYIQSDRVHYFITNVYTDAVVFRPAWAGNRWTDENIAGFPVEEEVFSAQAIAIASFGKANCCALCGWSGSDEIVGLARSTVGNILIYPVGFKSLRLKGAAALNPGADSNDPLIPQYAPDTKYDVQDIEWYNGSATPTTDEHYLGTGYARIQGFVFRTSVHPIFQQEGAKVRVYIGTTKPTYYDTDLGGSDDPGDIVNETELATHVRYAWCWAPSWSTTDWNYGALIDGKNDSTNFTKDLRVCNPTTGEEITDFTKPLDLPIVPMQVDAYGYHYVDIPVYSQGMKWTGVLFEQCDAEGHSISERYGDHCAPYLLTRLYGTNMSYGLELNPSDEPGNIKQDVIQYVSTSEPSCPDLSMLAFCSYWGIHGYRGKLTAATLPCVKALVDLDSPPIEWPNQSPNDMPLPKYATNTQPAAQDVNWYNGMFPETTDAHYLGLGYIRSNGFVFRTSAHPDFAKANACVRLYVESLPIDTWEEGAIEEDIVTHIGFLWCWADSWKTTDWNYSATEQEEWATNIKTYDPRTQEEVDLENSVFTPPLLAIKTDSNGFKYVDIPVHSQNMKWTGVLLVQSTNIGTLPFSFTQHAAPYLLARCYGGHLETYLPWDTDLDLSNEKADWLPLGDICQDLHMLTALYRPNSDYAYFHPFQIVPATASTFAPMTLPCAKVVINPNVKYEDITSVTPSGTDAHYQISTPSWTTAVNSQQGAYVGFSGMIIKQEADALFKNTEDIYIRIYFVHSKVSGDELGYFKYAWFYYDNWKSSAFMDSDYVVYLHDCLHNPFDVLAGSTKTWTSQNTTDLPDVLIQTDANGCQFIDIPVYFGDGLKAAGVRLFPMSKKGELLDGKMVIYVYTRSGTPDGCLLLAPNASLKEGTGAFMKSNCADFPYIYAVYKGTSGGGSYLNYYLGTDSRLEGVINSSNSAVLSSGGAAGFLYRVADSDNSFPMTLTLHLRTQDVAGSTPRLQNLYGRLIGIKDKLWLPPSYAHYNDSTHTNQLQFLDTAATRIDVFNVTTDSLGSSLGSGYTNWTLDATFSIPKTSGYSWLGYIFGAKYRTDGFQIAAYADAVIHYAHLDLRFGTPQQVYTPSSQWLPPSVCVSSCIILGNYNDRTGKSDPLLDINLGQCDIVPGYFT